jgi:hypothetical protein
VFADFINSATGGNIPSEKHARCADYFGIISGKNADKFDVSGLTPVKSIDRNSFWYEVSMKYEGHFPY